MSESSEASSGTPATGIVIDEPLDDVDAESERSDERSRRRRRRGGDSTRPRRTWREGGTSVHRWGWELVGWAVLALGAGVLGSSGVTAMMGGASAALIAQIVLWVAFAAAVVAAFVRSVPRGLLRLRPVDLLYGLVLGGMLRLAQGWLQMRAGGDGGWPSYPSLGGSLPSSWFFDDLLGDAVISPVVEEFFFRGLVLVAVYTAVRRLAGREVAMFAAAIVSTGLFVAAHALLAPLAWDAVVSLSLVGLVASLLVLLTGRLWPAVLVHVVYNGLWVAMATLGTLLAA